MVMPPRTSCNHFPALYSTAHARMPSDRNAPTLGRPRMHFAVLCSLLLTGTDPVAPTAFVARVQGEAFCLRGKDRLRLGPAELLLPGDRVEAGKGTTLVLVFLQDGHREKIV